MIFAYKKLWPLLIFRYDAQKGLFVIKVRGQLPFYAQLVKASRLILTSFQFSWDLLKVLVILIFQRPRLWRHSDPHHLPQEVERPIREEW